MCSLFIRANVSYGSDDPVLLVRMDNRTHMVQSFTSFVHLYVFAAGSMIRKKQLEEWLKGREEKKRLENKEKKRKPFYAGSRNVTGSSISVTSTTHVCCHGTKVKIDTDATSKSVVVAKERTKNTTQPPRYICIYYMCTSS